MSKLSIFTTCTINTPHRRDPWKEAIECYLDLADEVVIVTGHKDDQQEIEKAFPHEDRIKTLYIKWPYKWEWSELPKHLFEGLKHCTGDIAIKTDIDYFFHEDDHVKIREDLEKFLKDDEMVGRMLKVNVTRKDRGMIKSRTPIVINMNYKNKIRFGQASNKRTDWCEPLLVDNCCRGTARAFDESENPLLRYWVYNYDYFFCTKEQVKEEFWRFAQAYATAFGWDWGRSKEKAYSVWEGMQISRVSKSGEKINHPKYIKKRIDEMKPEEWGHSSFGLI